MKNFGGSWTENKLDTFIAYVKAYLTILNIFKQKYNWQTLYFDGFAGSGTQISQVQAEETLFSFDYKEEELVETKVYKGAVARVLDLPQPFKFDQYTFVDLNKSNIESLQSYWQAHPELSELSIHFKHSDCNQALIEFAQALTSRDAALIFLDPFGMQINWESIAALKTHTRSDIWILIPSGVAVNRLLTQNRELLYPEKLERFFGLSANEILAIFYREKPKSQLSLFDIEEDTGLTFDEPKAKIADATEKIAEIYVQQLQTIWKYVTEKPLVLYNQSGRAIFHFVFASHNENARKIAQQIITKRQT
jgi:three-Cys-motif partner protein